MDPFIHSAALVVVYVEQLHRTPAALLTEKMASI
jgi:hypothetical protein